MSAETLLASLPSVTPLPVDSDTSKTRSIAFVCGNKYGFRGTFLPLAQELARTEKLTVILLDYPSGYDIVSALKDVPTERDRGLVCWTLLPDSVQPWRHHRAAWTEARRLAKEGCDLLIVDADFMPMHRYLIDAARSSGARVIALQKDIPTQLMAAYDKALSASKRDEAGHQSEAPREPRRQWADFLRESVQSIRRRAVRTWRNSRDHYLYPFLLSGKSFPLASYESSGEILFASTRVDAVVVYDRRVENALNYFFPVVATYRVRHPRQAMCRCAPDVSPRRLLVGLGGPWHYHVTPSNSTAQIEERWAGRILEAVRLMRFEGVDIRPHPRERQNHPGRLVERLQKSGLSAHLLDPTGSSVGDILCDYAGFLSAPSGAISEAAISCRRAFVIGLDEIQGGTVVKPETNQYSDAVRCVRIDEPLSPDHFVRLCVEDEHLPEAADVIRRLARS